MNQKRCYFTFVIPVHDRGNEGKTYFIELLESINSQYFKNFEVVVSDSSDSDLYKEILMEYKFRKKHVRSNALTSSSNLNVALKNATGEYIKVMFSDDLIVSNLMLSYLFLITKLLKKKWILLSSYDFRKYKKNSKKIDPSRGRKPRWNNTLLIGNNTISSPSVLLFKNGLEMYFDEKVRFLMDTEFYWRFKSLHGPPYFSSRFYIANREHEGQDQHFVEEKTKIKEKNYVMKIHNYIEID
jgi:glycosyltransferase involved in cell wall biosynthesis